VLIIDDLLATGGTVEACCRLVEQCGATVAGCGFLINLAFLNGAKRLAGRELFSILEY
ncbi:MAG: adenine phosphoribosyltransferase, partial [Planctomycetaceae bacterium]|nr:adenine phosphoribosyltransferase [Planctomycetaceae bacterium]